MRIIRLPKKSGGWRVIYAPNPEEKTKLKALVPELNAAALAADKHGVSHGFMPGRSPVTNAMQHRGYMYSLSFDLAEWFETVTPAHIRRTLCPDGFPTRLQSKIEFRCFVDGAARQGLPTSPAIANLAASPMDAEIMALRVRSRLGWTYDSYTRYCDDLTFSFSREATAKWLLAIIPPLVERHGFKINPAKTKLQCARAGRRMITGVAVDNEIHPPRYIKRKVRAARHRMGKNPRARAQHNGLTEWARLVVPHDYEPPSKIKAAIRSTVRTILNAPRGFVKAVFGRKIIT
jgi:RNA-directed DNA polymerase